MNIEQLHSVAAQIDEVMPWIHGINSKSEYDALIALVGELVEDYDANKAIVDLAFPVIEKYEAESEQFRAFNEEMAKYDNGAAVLRALMRHHNLKPADLKPVLGSKTTVSLLVNDKRPMTLDHMKALSKRFGVPVELFI